MPAVREPLPSTPAQAWQEDISLAAAGVLPSRARMLALDRPLRRGPYLAIGAALMVAKVGVDSIVFALWHRALMPAFYVSPLATSLWTDAGELDPMMIAVFAGSVPFMVVGVVLTLRRLRDAGLPRWLAVLFFAPFAKFLFFAVCAAVPTRQHGEVVALPAGPYRERRFVILPAGSPGVAFVVATAAGAVVNLGTMGAAVWALKSYGLAVFLFAPAVAGFTSGLVTHRVYASASGLQAVGAAAAGYLVTMVVVVAFSAEGAGCLLMASPLLLVAAIMGATIGHVVGTAVPRRDLASPGASALVLLPLSLAVDHAMPVGDVAPAPIESVVIVDAPPEVVWKRVLAFPPLDPPTELVFRAGIAAPLSASIEGTGVGAVRRCEFTTGTFVEPIDRWDEGRELGFSVASQPDPMREATLYEGPRPPHLDGYLRSTRGQFVLEPLPGGRTRLIGRTWYEVHMAPAWYWRLWSDGLIHAIHLRVLRHVAKLAEADVAQ